MLKGAKKTILLHPTATHVDVFVEHYETLKAWSLQFTEHDHAFAEDLLHDAFIQFTLHKPDLRTIQNLEGYLFIMMRNLHLSGLRKAGRTALRPVKVVDFETVDISTWASDPRDRIRMRDELAAVCQFACIRKESAKSGSVLILRFFHGYYPEEIGKVLRSNTHAVTMRLQAARSEAKVFLEDPSKLAVLGDRSMQFDKPSIQQYGEDLRLELRRQIFASRRGECLPTVDLNVLYTSETADGIDHHTVAHIVSCPTCLESVNSLLDLPSLASRYSVDMLGYDPRDKDDGGDGGDGTGGAGGGRDMLESYFKRRDAHFHHQPEELGIAVNGQIQTFQRIVAGKGESTVVIDVDESLGFVEVFSEVGFRLLMMSIEPPPVGDGKQYAHIELSGGRTIDASLVFAGARPVLEVSYNDPSLAVLSEPEAVATGEVLSVPPAIAGVLETPLLPKEAWQAFRLTGWLSLFDLRSWLQPARITSAFAALLIAALLIYQFAPTTVSAAELLNKSAEQEIAQLANKERVLHRTLNLEEYKDGQLTSRKKIDVWHSAERGITARRLYDEQGRLVTGDWRSASGIQTIYQKGEAAKLQPLPEKRGTTVLFEDAWQLSLSAKEFNALINKPEETQLEERDNEYLISYEPKAGADLSVPPAVAGGLSPPQGTSAITRASITLSKEDLHAIEQSFIVKVGEETREYRMTEAAYEWRPANAVAPAVFEPNLELTGSTSSPPSKGGVDDASSDGVVVSETNTNSNTNTTAPSANMATAALEVEVIEALNNANAFMGEQINVSRTADGKILVTAMVETPARKQAILAALATVRNNPAVCLQIETVAEVQARLARQKGGNAKPGTVEQIEVREDQNPVLAELRKRLSDDEARNFANRVINRSRQARLHALAAKQIAERFSLADLQSLTRGERSRWVALVRGHAEKFLGELESIRRDLGPYFPEAASGSGGGQINSDSELQSKVRDLFQLSGTLQSGLDRSFSLNTTAGGTIPVMTAAFWRTFSNATGTARSIAAAK